jgi:phosphoglycerate kinase
MLNLKSLPIAHKKVLVRVDFNVPLTKEGKILDNSRIVAALPTIEYLLSQDCAVIIMSHLGRPKKGFDASLSLAPVAGELGSLLKKEVKMALDCVGEAIEEEASRLKEGEILLLENLRFHEGEEDPSKDPAFAKQLAKLAEYYVDDAFGCAHRAHASVVDAPRLFPGKAAPGFLMENEINFLGKALQNPMRPFLALIGGAKISSKIGVLKALSEKVDAMAIGGGMAFTFLKAQGIDVGNSLVENDFLDEAKAILDTFRKRNIPLLLPVDAVIAKEVSDVAETSLVAIQNGIPGGYMGLDIGPETIKLFCEAIAKAKTILWNGPMGVFEKNPFAEGTEKIAEAFAKSDATTIAGGGETVAAIQKTPWKSQVSHLSTGGGASLEYLELGTLPGIDILNKN